MSGKDNTKRAASKKKTKTSAKSKKRGKSDTGRKTHIISDAVIKTIAKRAGEPRISKKLHELAREAMIKKLDAVLVNALLFMEASKKETLGESHVRRALESMGVPVGMHTAGITYKTKRRKRTEDEGVKKPHRFHPGTQSAREVTHTQKSEGTLLKEMSVKNLIKREANKILEEQGNEKEKGLRVSKNAIGIIRVYLENYLRRIINIAGLIRASNKRETVMDRDFELALKIFDSFNTGNLLVASAE
jgi:histone H3